MHDTKLEKNYNNLVRLISQGYQKRLNWMTCAYTKPNYKFLAFLSQNGFIKCFQIYLIKKINGNEQYGFLIYLKSRVPYSSGFLFQAGVLKNQKPILRRGSFKYKSLKKLVKLSGSTLYILNTNKGILTSNEALRFGIGGRFLARVL